MAKAADSTPTPAIETPCGRISRAELTTQSGALPKEIDSFVALGLIAGPDTDGSYDAGDMTRLRLIKALESSGIPLDKLAAAIADDRLSLAFAGSIVAEPVGLTATSVDEARDEFAVSAEDFRRLMLALGFAVPDGGATVREDDREFMGIFASARELGVSDEVTLSTLRSYAISVRRLAEASRDLVREQIESRLLASGLPYRRMFEEAARMRVALQRFAYRTSFLLQRRLFEQAVYDNLVARFEEALEADDVQPVPRAVRRQVICFVDITGFTERTESFGDADAASVGAALVDIAQAQATIHYGHLVKALGDGAMLHFTRVEDAVHCANAILRVARESGLPPARAGIAVGTVVMQDGDYYGRTVNRASRLLGIAEPNQVLVTGDVPGTVTDPSLRFTDLGAVKLRGVNEEVFACSVAAV